MLAINLKGIPSLVACTRHVHAKPGAIMRYTGFPPLPCLLSTQTKTGATEAAPARVGE
jgi:hypothetical protein